MPNIVFAAGDYAAGALVGALTAGAIHRVIGEGSDVVLAMLIGTGIGLIVHIVVGVVLTPLLGGLHAFLPGSLIGMYGGMMFAMREAMQAPKTLGHALGVGIVFGVVIVGAVELYDHALRGANTEESH